MNTKIRFSMIVLAMLCSACATSLVVNSDGNASDVNPGDSKCETANNDCTLRAAIQEANSSNNADKITFDNIGTISLPGGLPALSGGNTTIDGGGVVTLDGGGNATSSARGLRITSSYNVIQGLTIVNFPNGGIEINGVSGEAANNVIGPTANQDATVAMRNVIGGNGGTGIYITGTGAHDNTIAGNYIGTDASGNAADPNKGGIWIGNGSDNNIIGSTQPASGSAVPTSSLAAYWTLDEASGTRADSVGANNLADNNTVGSAGGQQNDAADFERDNDEFLDIGDTAALSTGDIDFTIAGWVNPESVGQRTVLSKEDSASTREYSLIVGPNSLRFVVFDASGASIGLVDSSSALTPGNWYFFVVYHDATNDEIGISINNGPFVTAATSGVPSDTSASFRMGAKSSPAGSFYDGLIDEVGFWKRLLTTQEISSLYNGGNGVSVGPVDLRRNVISGNDGAGVYIHGAGNWVTGNYIGTNQDGTAALPNTAWGVHIGVQNGNTIGIATDGTGSGNVISGNGNDGVNIQSSNNIVAGNIIGLDKTGSTAVPNYNFGVAVALGSGNIIGTNGDGAFDDIEGNVISGNGFYLRDGVRLATSNNVVAGNLIGTNASGTASVGNHGSGVSLDAGGNRVGTNGDGVSDALERNVISGNDTVGVGVYSTNNVIAGNYIGVDVTGTFAVPNNLDGVYLTAAASNNVIGTDGDGTGDAAEGNLISGNGPNQNGAGVDIHGSSNTVMGNIIGPDASGLNPISESRYGVSIQGGAGNLIGTNGDGTSDALEGNVISGNHQSGVILVGYATLNQFSGNLIGTDPTGTVAVPNGYVGGGWAAVTIEGGSTDNIIGTNADGAFDAAERNIISGNAFVGIEIYGNGTDNNVVAGNYIGTDLAGNTALPNGLGILIHNQASSNRIGTNGDGNADAAERNVISGNSVQGVEILVSTGNEIAGNYIGTNAGGTQPLGNGRYGVNIDGSNTGSTDGNVVGGTIQKANVIAFNGWSGVRLGGGGTYPHNTPILYNSIHDNGDNGEVGINLQPGDTLYGVTPNDTGDGDAGSNDLMNYPELNTALAVNNSVSIGGAIVDGLPNTSFQIQFFSVPQCDQFSNHGEGEVYLGESTETTDGSGNVSFLVSLAQTVTPGEFITATATFNNNTSEFSECVEITAGQTNSLETTPPAIPTLTVIPNRNLNCRYFCTTQSDIADTLLEGIPYVPIGWDAEHGYLAFEGPTYGELCWAAPEASGTPLMSLTMEGQSLPVDQLGPDVIATRACPAFSTPTPTIDVDEGENATPTPTSVPECSDGIDNDGDGRVDYSATGRGDPECSDANDNNESR